MHFPIWRIIANFGVGYDAVDAKHAATRGVMVTNTPDVLSDEVADTAVGLLLNTVREFPKAETYLRAGRWATEGAYPVDVAHLEGADDRYFSGLAGSDWQLPSVWKPSACRSTIIRAPEGMMSIIPGHDNLAGLAKAVDTLIVVVPGGAATEKAVNAEVLDALGTQGVLISIGRGSTIDEDALITALADRRIAAAGLDVFANEPNVPQALMDLPNACLLPHVASASVSTRNAMADLVVDNLGAWLDGKPAITPVPECADLDRKHA